MATPEEQEAAAAKERRTYLIEIYKLYHGHTNTMFNYFLVLSGLIVNAFIVSMQAQAQISRGVSFAIALFGAFMSVIAYKIYLRSRMLIGAAEDALYEEELEIFPNDFKHGYFLRPIVRSVGLGKSQTHFFQFTAIYRAFIIGFLALAAYSGYSWSPPHLDQIAPPPKTSDSAPAKP